MTLHKKEKYLEFEDNQHPSSEEEMKWNREGANLRRDVQHITVKYDSAIGYQKTFRKRRKKDDGTRRNTPKRSEVPKVQQGSSRKAAHGGKKKKIPLDKPQFLFQALRFFQFASRRIALELIRNSRVSVNNHVVRDPNTIVIPGIDRLSVDMLTLYYNQPRSYIMYYKPPHEPASKEEGERNLHRRIPRTERWYFPAGRMTRSAQGLVILTNDPVHRNTLVTPMNYLPKEYHIKVHRAPTNSEIESLRQMLRGFHMANEDADVAIVRSTKRYCWLSIVTYRGMIDDITKMLKSLLLEPLSIHRVRIGGLSLDGLRPGEWRRMNEIDLAKLWGTNLEEASFFYKKPPSSFGRKKEMLSKMSAE